MSNSGPSSSKPIEGKALNLPSLLSGKKEELKNSYGSTPLWMPEISPSESQRFKEKQFITILRDMMPKHSYVPPKFYSCPKHMKSLQDFCIQRPFSPHEKQTEYLFTYVRLSPLGTGPKPNNQPLLRRWL